MYMYIYIIIQPTQITRISVLNVQLNVTHYYCEENTRRLYVYYRLFLLGFIII